MTRNTAASYANVQEMAERLHLSAQAYRRAVEIARLKPDRDGLTWLYRTPLLRYGRYR